MPTSAPNFGVTINSPEPTIEAVMIKPGPRYRSVSKNFVGAFFWREDMAREYQSSAEFKIQFLPIPAPSSPRINSAAALAAFE